MKILLVFFAALMLALPASAQPLQPSANPAASPPLPVPVPDSFGGDWRARRAAEAVAAPMAAQVERRLHLHTLDDARRGEARSKFDAEQPLIDAEKQKAQDHGNKMMQHALQEVQKRHDFARARASQ